MNRIFAREVPEIPPTTPYDPGDPDDDDDESIPLPPDRNPRPVPIREPDDEPPPVRDPSIPEPTRLR
jgi:hypothetical protein